MSINVEKIKQINAERIMKEFYNYEKAFYIITGFYYKNQWESPIKFIYMYIENGKKLLTNLKIFQIKASLFFKSFVKIIIIPHLPNSLQEKLTNMMKDGYLLT